MILPGLPQLTTDRLILRGPAMEDFEPAAAFGASSRAEFVGGRVDRYQAWRGFLTVVGHWAVRGYGLFTLVLRDGGAIAGRTGLINHDGWPEPELGWHLFDGFEGAGYATEAALAVRAHAASAHGLTRLISLIEPENTRSVALARRLGAAYERDAVVTGAPCQIWRHPEQPA
jgi:RimJ/RimL family protein N-acetyltransferase